MFVKSSGIKGNGGRLLNYISRPNAVLKDKQGNVIYIKHNLTGSTIEEFLEAFEENEKLRLHPGTNRNKFYHDFISFNPDSSQYLTPEVLEDLARKYMELRAEYGIGVAVSHVDKGHRHLHVVMAGTEYATGQAIRISRDTFSKIKSALQEYQQLKYPELEASLVKHGKGIKDYTNDNEVQMKQRTGKSSRKDELRDILTKLFDESLSEQDFHKKIEAKGLQVYERGGKVVGIKDERNHRFSTLGFNNEHWNELNIRNERMNELRVATNEPTKETSLELRNKFSSNYESETVSGAEDQEHENSDNADIEHIENEI